ncbi:MAG: hypothetical protein FWH21_02230 [Kiritimatiellaeota bacterium]|nr:hypothetical protein [Kiritimatiellota bacterium]
MKKNKVMMVVAACCAGMILGWLLRSGMMGGGRTPQGGVSPAGGQVTQGGADIPVYVPPSGGRASSRAEAEDDDMEERMAQRGIQMQASADETRQAIIENASLNDVQAARLDTIIADMNRQMTEVSTKWADHIRATGTLDINTRMKMQHEISGVMVSVSDAMDGEFPGWRGKGDDPANVDISRLIRVTTAFEPFRKIRSEILRGEMGNRGKTEEDSE